MNTPNLPPTGTAAGAIGIVLAGMTIAVGLSAAISFGIAPPAWFAGSSLVIVIVVFAPSLIKPSSAGWRTAVDTSAARLLLGIGLVIAALTAASAIIGLPPLITLTIAAVMAGYTIGTTLAISKLNYGEHPTTRTISSPRLDKPRIQSPGAGRQSSHSPPAVYPRS